MCTIKYLKDLYINVLYINLLKIRMFFVDNVDLLNYVYNLLLNVNKMWVIL